jgi:hypothetical protein
MIDADNFYKRFGALHQLGPDEQLMIAEGLRLACEVHQWTLFFEQVMNTEDQLQALFNCARKVNHVIPFSTRSGWLAIRCPSVANEDETAVSADKLRQVLEEFGVSIHLAY